MMASRLEISNIQTAHAGAPVGRRASQRARLQLAATVEGTTRRYDVLLRNLSSTGAMVEGGELPPAGRTVALTRDGLDAFGTVVWSDEERCGIHFDEPIDTEQVIWLARSAPEAMEARGFRCYQRAGTAGDRLSAEDWAQAKALAERHKRGFR
jgi:hypothetical protein